MADPSEVLARQVCCAGQCEGDHCAMTEGDQHKALRYIAALRAAGFRIVDCAILGARLCEALARANDCGNPAICPACNAQEMMSCRLEVERMLAAAGGSDG